jgi:hypothetical protein
VREKWFRDIDPTVDRNLDFSPTEDARLLRLVQLLGAGKWSTFAEWLPGRTDDVVLHRWKVLSGRSSTKEYLAVNEKKRRLNFASHGRKAKSCVHPEDFVKVVKADV